MTLNGVEFKKMITQHVSGCGRGARHGAVSIKVERLVRNQESQENGGVYEDEIVYVTERPRRRGRPRKPASVASVTPRPPPKPLPQQFPRSNEVIYVSAARGRPQYVIPSRNPVQHSVVHQPPQRTATLVQGSRQLSVCAAVCPRPVRCVLSGVTSAGQTIGNVPKPVLTLGVQRINAETKIDWPADLQELVSNWDNLPERRTRDVVKWFQTVSSNSQQPKIVCEIQEMWSNMPETWEEKVDLALEWLQDNEPLKNLAQPSSSTPLPGVNAAPLHYVNPKPNGVTLPPHVVTTTSNSVVSQLKSVAMLSVSRAKVLVEAQPNPIQDCGQWSSMAENRENCNH